MKMPSDHEQISKPVKSATTLHCVVSNLTSAYDAAALVRRTESADKKSLKFRLKPGTEELHQYRISAVFESHPEVDHIVIGMGQNGFRYIGDLQLATLRDVFANIDAPLHETRWVIDSLKAHLRLSVDY